MKISVVIPTKNEEKNLPALLESIKKQTFKDFETIIVDNFSNDKTRLIASRYTINMFKKGPERSTQKNYGLKKAKGEYVLFLDSDMILGGAVLEDCFKAIANNPKLSGIIISEQSRGSNFLAKIKSLEKELYKNEPTLEAARFFRKKDLKKIGGFNEKLISGEDWDLSQRMTKLGNLGRIRSKIYHLENLSILEDVKKKYYYAKFINIYAKKHPLIFKRQAGLFRIGLLFKKPKIIISRPIEFLGLLLLKSLQYFSYLLVKATRS